MGKAKKLGIRRFINKGYKLDSPNINKFLCTSNSLYYTVHTENSKQEIKDTGSKMDLINCVGKIRKVNYYKIDKASIIDRYNMLKMIGIINKIHG